MTAAITATEPASELRWVTAAVLVALAARGYRTGRTFNTVELVEWVPGLAEGRKCNYATEKLLELEFVTFSLARVKGQPRQRGHYTITAAGAAAIQAAAAGKVPKAGAPRGPKNIPPAPTTFVARLWALVRARQILDTETAAATLIDAGSAAEAFARARASAMTYFRLWEKAGVLAASKKRLPNGCKRYVLVKDVGPVPPAWCVVKAPTKGTNAVTK